MNSKKSFRIQTKPKFGTNEDLAAIADLPASQIAEFREIFRLIDTDESNTLSLDELKQLLENLHFDTMLLEDEFFLELVGKVRKVKQRSSACPTPGTRRSSSNASAVPVQFQEVTFDELMSALLARPPIEKQTKAELRRHFAALGIHECVFLLSCFLCLFL
jgi:hypothetical protein